MQLLYCTRIILVILICSFAIPTGAQQVPPKIPDTPSGRLLTHLLNAFNSGEEDQWKSFIWDHWKEKEGAFERRFEFFKQVYSDLFMDRTINGRRDSQL
jgi:hypothetical protein